MNCLNCNTEINSKFCPNCGQKASTERITFKSFSRSVTSDIINADKGILFNLKNLTIRPGKSINDYIDGKRKNIFNPISYALLTISAYLILSKYIGSESGLKEEDFEAIKSQETFEYGKQLGRFTVEYIKFFFLLHIVYLSVFEKLFFSKKNIYELMTINAFIVGHSIVIGMLFFPILKYPLIFDPIIYTSILILSFFVFKKKQGKTESLAIPVFSLFMSFILMFAIPALVLYVRSLFQ